MTTRVRWQLPSTRNPTPFEWLAVATRQELEKWIDAAIDRLDRMEGDADTEDDDQDTGADDWGEQEDAA